MKYKRVLVKLSGEALKGEDSQILDAEKLTNIAKAIKLLRENDVQVCIVVGAGNIWRGNLADSIGIEQATADYMGMLGTIINGMAIANAVEREGNSTRVMTSLEIKQVAEPYIHKRALRHLEKGRVVIFTAGTGNPYFTTDTAAALRAREMYCDAILMAKNGVEGIYTADPHVDKSATLIKNITYAELLSRNLKVMDATAVSILRESDIVTRVFDMGDIQNFARIINDEPIGTTIRKGE